MVNGHLYRPPMRGRATPAHLAALQSVLDGTASGPPTPAISDLMSWGYVVSLSPGTYEPTAAGRMVMRALDGQGSGKGH